MQSSSKLCYSISPGSMLAAAAPASRCKAQPKPCDTVLASCWLQSLKTQTIGAEGLIICSNLWGEDELGQHRDKKYKTNSAPLLLMGYSVCVEGSWGGEEGGQGVHIILSAFQMTASTLNKRLSLLSEPRDVTHITAGSSTCVPVCDSAETRHTHKKKKKQHSQTTPQFFSPPNTQKACLLDGLWVCCFLSTQQLWAVCGRHLAERSSCLTSGLSDSIGNYQNHCEALRAGVTCRWYIQSCPNSFLDSGWCEDSVMNMWSTKTRH